MGKGGKGSYKSRHKQRQLLCTALTLTLIALAIALAVLYFLLFKPKDPRVEIPAMQLLALAAPPVVLSAAAAPPPTIAIATPNVTLDLHVSIRNPNRAVFHVQRGSKARLFYDRSFGQEAGYASIPEGAIAPKSISTLSVPLSSFQQGDGGDGSGAGAAMKESAADLGLPSAAPGILQMGVSVTVVGKVTTLGIFSHHAVVLCSCGLDISFVSRGIESFTCQRSFSVDA